jgi:hypothetical protein
MSKTSAWIIAEQERQALHGTSSPDDIDWNWESEYADMLAKEDPELIPSHDYATETEWRDKIEATTETRGVPS